MHVQQPFSPITTEHVYGVGFSPHPKFHYHCRKRK